MPVDSVNSAQQTLPFFLAMCPKPRIFFSLFMINSKAISILQIGAIVAVVTLHFCISWNYSVAEMPVMYWFNSLLKGGCFTAVPIFVLISGYCLSAKNVPVVEFYRKRLRKIAFPLLFWSAFYLLLRAFSSNRPSVLTVFEDLLFGRPYFHLWYLYMILGLYVVAPLLLHWKRHCPRRLAVGELALLALVFGFPKLWETTFFQLFFLRFFPYCGLFIAGFYLHYIPVKRWIMGVFATFSGLYFSFLFVSTLLGTATVWNVYYYLGIPALIGSVALTGLALQMEDWSESVSSRRRLFVETSACAFGIYLVHPVFIAVFVRLIHHATPGPLVYLTGLFVVLILCWVTVMIGRHLPFFRLLFG